jgi:YesN/AraC family two-component response regulator|tara:strand:+ start:428 stop:979 length:552 start_codon:yes stop_codon:yes gene_type:complete
MGRFYSGDIEGKFWFGVQQSDDIENLVNITSNTEYVWKACNCYAEIDCEDYCRQCYDSKEQQIEEAIEAEEYDDSSLYYEDSSHGYSLDKETHYQELLDNMKLLKQEIPEDIIKKFENIEQTDNILNAFTGVFDKYLPIINEKKEEKEGEKKELAVLVARYTLGYQIEYCLRTTGSCNVNCEY